jgi:hypothetical protein
MTKTRAFLDSRQYHRVGPKDGVYYVGRPDWLTADLFAALQQEAEDQRPGAEKIRFQYFGDPGPLAHSLMSSAELRSFVVENSVPAYSSGEGNYRYYDIPESQVRPHVDGDKFAVNLLIMLKHSFVTEQRSGLLLFPRGPQEPVSIMLEPGEVILFNAKDVIHARTPISGNGDERAVNLGIGFTPNVHNKDHGFWYPTEGWHNGLN